MQYVEAKATTTPMTDLGQFRAVVATWDRDRDRDVIRRGAFSHSIQEWRSVGKRLPLHWHHRADEIIGEVDPQEMWEDDQGLLIEGKIDLDDEQGRKVWKQLKANRLGFSFGYVATRSRARKGGGRELLELDVYEVSATPAPANNQTRVLSTKAADESRPLADLSLTELRARSDALVAGIDTKAREPIRIATFDC